MLDLLIRGGTIVDGTGNPPFIGCIGIDGDVLHVFRGGDTEHQAVKVIDAKEKVVCPGFIDFHAHSGLMLFDKPEHETKVRQGVTTEVLGVDGNSYAPFLSVVELARFKEFNSGLDGNPDIDLSWSSVAEYLSLFDRKVAVNVAYLIGNSPLRISAMGWGSDSATARSLANMCAMLREGMEEGAFGLSTGLDYPPGAYADTDELVRLCEVVAGHGGIYHTHVRYALGDGFLDPLREAVEIGQRSESLVHITHLYRTAGSPGGAERILGLVEDSRDDGVDVTFDSYPYTYSSTRLTILMPFWAQEAGPEGLLDVLGSADGRARLRSDLAPRGGASWQEMWITSLVKPDNIQFDGMSVAEIAAATGKSEVDAVCDLLVTENLGVSYVAHNDNGLSRTKFLTHPLSMVGSDALLIGEYPSPRSYGTFPKVLGDLVREEKLMPLAAAVRKMTSFPAQRLGIRDRGRLETGKKADVVIFDPLTISSPSTRPSPKQYPTGIEYVIINGQLVIECSAHTGALPGMALRHSA